MYNVVVIVIIINIIIWNMLSWCTSERACLAQTMYYMKMC